MLAFAFQLSVNAQAGNKAYNLFLKSIYHKKTSTISCDSLNTTLDEYTVLDIRSEDEYKVSHIKGAQFINFDTYKDSDFTLYDKEAPIALYCSVGWRSQEVTEYLRQLGFNNVHNVYGGIFEWSNKGLPLNSIKGEDTDSVHVFSKKWGFWLKNGIKVY